MFLINHESRDINRVCNNKIIRLTNDVLIFIRPTRKIADEFLNDLLIAAR